MRHINVIEADNNSTATLTQTIHESHEIDSVLKESKTNDKQKDELKKLYDQINKLLQEKKEPSKIKVLLNAMYSIAPDVAKYTTQLLSNPLSIIGIISETIFPESNTKT